MTQPAQKYTSRDYSALFEWLIELLKTECPEITDWNHASPNTALIRLVARALGQEHHYLDQVFREMFVSFARFKQSLIDLGRSVDFLPVLWSAATTTLRVTRESGVSGDIVIPKYSVFSRSDGITYLTQTDVTLLDGTDEVDINAIQGTEVNLTVPPGSFTLEDETGHYRYNLGVGVAAGSVEVSHGDPAQPWTEVDSFYDSDSTDLHFLCLLQADPITTGGATDTAWLVVGDGAKGQGLPVEDLEIRFVQTDGAGGNCGHSVITTVPPALDGQITATNTVEATGGATAETIESLRESIMEVTHAQRRGVIKRDYEALVGHIAGVLHVQCIDRNDDDWWPHLRVVLYVVPEGGGAMSSQLKADIVAECTARGTLGPWEDRYLVYDATEKSINVSVKIGVLTGYSSPAVIAAVETAVIDFFDADNHEIGGTVEFIDLYSVVTAVSGVSWVQFTTPTSDTTVDDDEIPVAGTITVTAS